MRGHPGARSKAELDRSPEVARSHGARPSHRAPAAQGLEATGSSCYVGGLGFALGPRLLGLAATAMRDLPLRDLAQPVLERLARSTGESAQLFVRDGDRRVCIDGAESRQRAPDDRRDRRRAPAHGGARRARCSSRWTAAARPRRSSRPPIGSPPRRLGASSSRRTRRSAAGRIECRRSEHRASPPSARPIFGAVRGAPRGRVRLRARVSGWGRSRRSATRPPSSRPRRRSSAPSAPSYQAYASGAGPPGPGKISSSLRKTSSSRLDLERAERALELLLGPRADDRGRHRRLVQEPRERDIRRPRAQVGADLLVALQPIAVLVDLVLQVLGGATTLVDLLERSGQQAAGERAPGDQAHPVLLDRRDHLELERALGQVVEGLLGREARPCATCSRSRSPSRCASRRSSTIPRRGSCPRSSAGPSPPRSRSTTRSGRCGASDRGRCSRSADA